MRKVIGIGETILDIIFRNDQPSAAVPGGSVFNGIVSLDAWESKYASSVKQGMTM